MTSQNERTTITLDYLKGKRRAEKALGFLTTIGSRLVACDTREQLARTVVDYVTRLDIAVCLLELRPRSGAALSVAAQAPDLEHEMPNDREIVTHCRKVAERIADPDAPVLERSDTTSEIGDTTVLVSQFSLNHPDVGTGSLSVARLCGRQDEFTPAELTLLADVASRFVSAVRCPAGEGV